MAVVVKNKRLISKRNLAVLAFVLRHPGATSTDLRWHFGWPSAWASGALAHLHTQGLIGRQEWLPGIEPVQYRYYPEAHAEAVLRESIEAPV